ncbi:MAG: IPT/TIG domain-containing protein [Candidatus Methanoperedens sp.]|nr:IPT/TIG domain-containing protein [Candidatus Methanoperedens sp.]
MNMKIKLLILGIVALIAVSGCLQSQIQLDGPMATLTIVKSNYGINNSQGFGSYCLKDIWIGPCKDKIGILTLQEPLPVGSPFTAHLLLPLQDTPKVLQLSVIRVTSEDKLKGGEENAWQLWRFQEGKRFMLPLESEQDIELSLEPGLYVLKIGAAWKEKGNLSYGFLLEVRANDTGVASTTLVSPVNQTPPLLAITPLSITAIQPDAGTIGTKVVITGTGFTAKDNNVAFRIAPEDSNTTFIVGYINHLISRDGKTIEFVIPEGLGACAFPLPETTPVTVCPAIGISFKPGTQTYPVFVVNQNGTSNNVNITVSQ